MHELQSLLLQKLPRLGELTFGCYVKRTFPKVPYIDHLFPGDESYDMLETGPEEIASEIRRIGRDYSNMELTRDQKKTDVEIEILGHPFTHADILEALGEDWAMDGAYYLLQNDGAGSFEAVVLETEEGERNIILPKNLSDLSLPEYEETRKQLIQLLTK